MKNEMMNHNASHKNKRLGEAEYILGEGWMWHSWTDCETCGEIEHSRGFEGGVI